MMAWQRLVAFVGETSSARGGFGWWRIGLCHCEENWDGELVNEAMLWAVGGWCQLALRGESSMMGGDQWLCTVRYWMRVADVCVCVCIYGFVTMALQGFGNIALIFYH